jgi:hypothetical protein
MRDRFPLATSILLLTFGCQSEPPAESSPDPTPAPAADADADAPEVTKAEPEPEPPPPPAKPEGYAVLAQGAAVYARPDGPALAHLPGPADGGRPFAGLVVMADGEEGGKVRIQTLPPDAPPACSEQLSGLADFSLRMYVARESFLPVTTAAVRHEFGDGTSIALVPGVPLLGDDPQARRVVAAGASAQLPVPAESTGEFYVPGEMFSRSDAQGNLTPEGSPLRYDGNKTLDATALFLGRDGDRAHFGVTNKLAGVQVTVRNACMEAVVRTMPDRVVASAAPQDDSDEEEVETQLGRYAMKGPKGAIPQMARKFDPDMMAENAGILGTLGAANPDEEDVWGGLTGSEVGEAYGIGGLGLVGLRGYAVAANAKVLWPDGTTAGTTRVEHRFEDEPRDVDGRQCWDVPLVTGREASVTLCFDPADVEGSRGSSYGTIGLGSTGLIGSGSGSGSGYGRGTGAGFGGRGKRVPTVRQSKATVTGSLDKDIIRRIVRAHINEVRYCYNQGLVKDPKLEGKVTIAFVISASGSVASADVDSDDLSDKAVGKCVAKAVKRWKFPRPTGGGIVSVKYPFMLEPGA